MILSCWNVRNVDELGSGVEISNETLSSLKNTTCLGLDVRDSNSPRSFVISWNDNLIGTLGKVLVKTTNVDLANGIMDIDGELF